uniref:Uncharacterized protein n=1 Tax=uncultured prokaryote TaxID=198431 RepID=A0A0H5QPT5_9ZZZZ|nr:hypothetical protein [uncultured prokaryote]
MDRIVVKSTITTWCRGSHYFLEHRVDYLESTASSGRHLHHIDRYEDLTLPEMADVMEEVALRYSPGEVMYEAPGRYARSLFDLD